MQTFIIDMNNKIHNINIEDKKKKTTYYLRSVEVSPLAKFFDF